MNGKLEAYQSETLQWVNDLALYRSLMGRVPWMERFGQGQMKALSFDEQTQAGAWLLQWPEGYNPLKTHAHGGNEHLFVLEGDLVYNDKQYTKDAYLYFPKGVSHSYEAGKRGCVFLSVIDGAFFDEKFLKELMASGPASRHRDPESQKA